MKMHRLLALLLAACLLPACAGPRAIAVVNQTDASFVLRFKGQWAWEVPPHSSGIGPVDIIMGWSQTEILRDDCSRWAGWGLQGPTTIEITDAGDPAPGLVGGAHASQQLEPTNRCTAE